MAAMPKLHAERQLQAIEAASAPHLTDQTRGRILGRLSRRARGDSGPRTAGEALASVPIPVIREPVKRGES